MNKDIDLSEQIIEIYRQLKEEENDLISREMDIKNRYIRFEKDFVYIEDKKDKSSTRIFKKETDKSLLNRMKNGNGLPLEWGKLLVDDKFGGHLLTEKEFKKILNDKDLKLLYFDCLKAEDINKAIKAQKF